ncbi:hypothetical protein AB1Y20_011176 [Prymnesium parvum]|uniref:Sugar phosphate transporter domain-containing protein n=1 Tax=Prymnesium parvum TaxID=97485 RepID=A0AB34IPA4_PRYPA
MIIHRVLIASFEAHDDVDEDHSPPAHMAWLARLRALYLIAQWIFLSSCIILFNQRLLSGRFPFPCTLVSLHMAFVSLCAAAWRASGWADVPRVRPRDWPRRFLPVGVCFAASLILSNAAYAYISVAFIQMVKASTPVVVLLLSFALRIERANAALGGYIWLISSGVALSCASQVDVTPRSHVGLALQLGAVGCEAMRLCLTNLLLTSSGIQLSPIASLYYLAPTSLLCLLVPWLLLEASSIASIVAALREVGLLQMTANASVAFVLNLATMALLKHTSALTLNVAGVVKDLLLIWWSVVVNGAIVSQLQLVGYAIALTGVTGYSSYKRRQGSAPSPARDLETETPKEDPSAREEQPLLSAYVDDEPDDMDHHR